MRKVAARCVQAAVFLFILGLFKVSIGQNSVGLYLNLGEVTGDGGIVRRETLRYAKGISGGNRVIFG